MSASDSHRAEVRESVLRSVAFLLGAKPSEVSTESVAMQTVDEIMALLDTERERWIGEVLTDILRHKKKDGTGWVVDAHIVADRRTKALDSVSKGLGEISGSK